MATEEQQSVPWLLDVPAAELQRIVSALYRVHRLISVITDLDTLLERIMEEGKQLAQAEACSLMLYDPVSEELFFQVALGEEGDQQTLKREIRLALDQGIAGAAAARREPINVEDVQTDDRFFRLADERIHFKTRSLLALPLLDRDKLIGVIEVLNKVGGAAFTTTDLHVMQMFCALSATTIANARLIEESLRAERLAAIGQAVAGLSHHIKNILTGMSGSVDLIDQGIEKENLEFLKRGWPILRRSARRIASFVENMLAFSKPRKPALETIDLEALFEEVSQTFWGLLLRRDVTLEMHVDKAVRRARLDSRGLYRCMLNLLLNASEAVSRGEGHIRMTAAKTDNGWLAIEVADNGPGIPDAYIHRIFEPFFSTKGSQGTGLGLAVTQKTVAEHGGQITVSRAPEGGALFRIVLPQEAPQDENRIEGL